MTGEFARIDAFLAAFREAGGATSGPGVPLGPGDDCAVLDAGAPLAVTTDAVFEGVHFRRDWASARSIGHKALAVNLSDLAAMGAEALAFTCAVGLPRGFDDAELLDIARGMGALAARCGAVLAGGNFSGAQQLSLTVTAFGRLDHPPLRRATARAGDRVLLCGAVGEAGAQLRALQEGRPFPLPALAPGPLHEPHPRLAEGREAARAARCAIDVSDGLVQDLGHVAAASRVRVRLDFARIPRTPLFEALAAPLPSRDAASLLLSGGEDYALVIVAPPDVAADLAARTDAVEIGAVEPGSGVVVDGAPAGTPLGGWDHFA